MLSYRRFHFWCQKVLPTIYDDSLSYYEVVCKLADGFEKLMEDQKENSEDISELQEAVKMLREEMDALKAGEYVALLEIISNAMKNVYFGLTDSGYFIAYVPESWGDIQFNTTGYDYNPPEPYEYGHLVLSMDVENPEWGPNYCPACGQTVTP